METPPRRRFSERMGLVPVVVQTDGMNSPLMFSIWNTIRSVMYAGGTYNDTIAAVNELAAEVLRVPVDSVTSPDPVQWLQQVLLGRKWYDIYDALEYVALHADRLSASKITRDEFVAAANRVLEREHSGFRFIGGGLTRVMHPAEAAGVEDAMAKAKASGLDGVHEHITQALVLLGKRPDPDYRNAIKEAISAVESAVKVIEGVRGGGLKDALDALAKRIEIHAALRDGLVKLYGFTSDEDGIRHPILDAPNVDEEDARFMIVTCSAAVNWIIAKAEKAGLLRPQ